MHPNCHLSLTFIIFHLLVVIQARASARGAAQAWAFRQTGLGLLVTRPVAAKSLEGWEYLVTCFALIFARKWKLLDGGVGDGGGGASS